MSSEAKPVFPIYQMMDRWAAFAYATPEVKSHHHALYFALATICKNKGGMSRYTLPYQTGMELSGIGSKSTYLTALKELEEWGFLTYTPGANRFTVPIIEVHFCTSIGNLLAFYRESIDTSIDTSIAPSTDRNKELIDSKTKEVEDLKTVLVNKDEELATLRAALASAQSDLVLMTAERDKLAEEVATLKTQPRGLRTPGGAAVNLVFPDWATDTFRAEWQQWVDFRQGKRDKLKPASLQKMLDKLGTYDEEFSSRLFDKAITNGYTGLIYEDTDRKFAEYLAAKPENAHLNLNRHAASTRNNGFNSAIRGQKPDARAGQMASALASAVFGANADRSDIPF
ncbi:hypothetical protein [Hymenobacter fodinae]|uniref:Uncharacterized protein n=1 Tax=Hymenobacter fodinae TaxID=2510796 RepID=A0A4Z0P2K6_9BACT|nr:hypothetical protein [Hymenobacter fodinae]TGE05593.1 hypothetical protein EU556_20035 [Hymenobacter fodinae]